MLPAKRWLTSQLTIMKKNRIIFWISTIIFAGFMIFSAIPNIRQTEQSDMIFNYLGYPLYLAPFVGWAKLLGALTLLVPRVWRLKEWAYAGLFFDLIGATYSLIVKGGVDPSMSMMLIPFVAGIVSYIYHLKLQKAAVTTA